MSGSAGGSSGPATVGGRGVHIGLGGDLATDPRASSQCQTYTH